MTSLPIASLASQGRGVLSSSTVLHVLRLVHYGYTSTSGPSSHAVRTVTRCYSSRSTSVPLTRPCPCPSSLHRRLTSTRPYGASAHAIRDHFDFTPDELEHTLDEHDHDPDYESECHDYPPEPPPLPPKPPEERPEDTPPLGLSTTPFEEVTRSMTDEELNTVDERSQLTPAFIRRVWAEDVPSPPVIRGNTLLQESIKQYHSKNSNPLPGEAAAAANAEKEGQGERSEESTGHRPLSAYDQIGVDIRLGRIPSVESLIQAVSKPSQLASVYSLTHIFRLLQRKADLNSWSWLAMRVEEMLQQLETMEGGIYDPTIPPIAHALLGHALLQGLEGMDPKWTAKRQVLARMQVNQSLRFRSALPRTLATSSFELSLCGLVLAQLHEWENAMDQFSKSIKRHVTIYEKFRYPAAEMTCLEEYRRVCNAKARFSDLSDIAASEHFHLHQILRQNQPTQPKVVKFCATFMKAFANIPQPVEWFEARYKAAPTNRTRNLGGMLFIALTTSRNVAVTEQCVRLFDRLMSLGIPMSPYHVVRLCATLDKINHPDVAFRVYFTFLQDNPRLSHVSLNTMLRVFLDNERWEDAAEIQKEIISRFAPTKYELHCLADIHARRGDVKGTVSSLQAVFGPEAMKKPALLGMVQTAYINADDPNGARKILEKLSDIDPTSIEGWNRQSRCYAFRGDVAAAIQLFDHLLATENKPNADTYTALITLFGLQRDLPNVNRIVEAVLASGVQPDAKMCAAILNADVLAGEYDSAAARWKAFPAAIQSDRGVLAAILKAFVYLSAPVSTVMRVFKRIERPGVKHYSLALLSMIDHGQLAAGQRFIESMDRKAEQDRDAPRPNIYIFSTIMYAFLSSGKNEAARGVYDEILLRRLVPTSVTYGMIIQSFLLSKDKTTGLDQAHGFAVSILKKSEEGMLPETASNRGKVNQHLFGPLVSAAGVLGKSETAQAYFDLATNDRPPTLQLYARLMDAYRRSGDIDHVVNLWEKALNLALEMVQPLQAASSDPSNPIFGAGVKLQSNLLCIPLSIVIDSLSTQQRLSEIFKIWKSAKTAGFAYDGPNYQHLAVALIRCGHIEGAFHVIDRVLLRRWDEIRKRRRRVIREQMKLLELSANSEIPSEDQMLKEDQDRRYAAEPFEDHEGKMFTPLDVLYREQDPVDPSVIEGSNEQASPSNISHRRRWNLRREATDAMMAKKLEDHVVISNMLTHWRPGDLEWKPSRLTRRIISLAYGQIQIQRRRIQSALSPDQREELDNDENDDLSEFERDGDDETHEIRVDETLEERRKRMIRPHIVTLPDFDNAPVRDHKGTPKATTPSAILWRLNRKYPRVCSLIALHRHRAAIQASANHRKYTERAMKAEKRLRMQRHLNRKRKLRDDHRRLPDRHDVEEQYRRIERYDRWIAARQAVAIPEKPQKLKVPEFGKSLDSLPLAYPPTRRKAMQWRRWWFASRLKEEAERERRENEKEDQEAERKEESRKRKEELELLIQEQQEQAEQEARNMKLRRAQEKGFATGFGLKTGGDRG